MSDIDFTGHDENSSLFDPNYTYSYDKYSCIRGFYFAHLVFNNLVSLSGAGCLLTRVLPRYKWMHAWLGRIYILSMLWSATTSLLMNNTGLPLTVIISFGAVMGGLTIGWISIVMHKQNMDRAATSLVQERLIESASTIKDEALDLGRMLQEAKAEVAEAKTFRQRFVSLKALHGVVFFVSWTQITGRIFASNQSGDFTCYTYPVYKPIDTPEGDYASENLTVVSERDPAYSRLPWANGAVAWSLQLILGSMFGAMFVGAVWSWWSARKASQANNGTCAATEEGRRNSDPSSHSTDGDDGFAEEEQEATSTVDVESAVSVEID